MWIGDAANPLSLLSVLSRSECVHFSKAEAAPSGRATLPQPVMAVADAASLRTVAVQLRSLSADEENQPIIAREEGYVPSSSFRQHFVCICTNLSPSAMLPRELAAACTR